MPRALTRWFGAFLAAIALAPALPARASLARDLERHRVALGIPADRVPLGCRPLRQARSPGEAGAVELLVSAPAWVDGPWAAEWLAAVRTTHIDLEMTDLVWLVRWLDANRPGALESGVRALKNQITGFAFDLFRKNPAMGRHCALKLMGLGPFAEFPPPVRAWLNENYLLPEIAPGLPSDRVGVVGRGLCRAGACQDMYEGHLRSRRCGAGLDFFLAGEFVGRLKFVGDRSFLAHRTVRDPEGRVTLAIGGVYHLPLAQVNALEERFVRGGRATDGGRRRGRVDLDFLGVSPLAYLYSAPGPNRPPWPELVARLAATCP